MPGSNFEMRWCAAVLSMLFVWLAAGAVQACLWDKDTLAMERRAFPKVLELITGKFLRHTPELYRWRVEDRTRRLQADPDDLAAYDDLAVALDKLGETEQAIDVMLRKAERAPGLYETHANLGTFYAHSGRMQDALVELDRAIEINPDAHFGREIYQRLLIEYVLEAGSWPPQLPMKAAVGESFASFVVRKRVSDDGDVDAEIAAATKGVAGMMHFGKHDSVVLLEALGDLLDASGANWLAARAYLKASYEVRDDPTKRKYRKMARRALSRHDTSLSEVEAKFKAQLKEARLWYSMLERDERAWVADDEIDPDAAFDAKYYEDPKIGDVPDDPLYWWEREDPNWLIWVGAGLLAVVALLGTTAFVLRPRVPDIE